VLGIEGRSAASWELERGSESGVGEDMRLEVPCGGRDTDLDLEFFVAGFGIGVAVELESRDVVEREAGWMDVREDREWIWEGRVGRGVEGTAVWFEVVERDDEVDEEEGAGEQGLDEGEGERVWRKCDVEGDGEREGGDWTRMREERVWACRVERDDFMRWVLNCGVWLSK
jgi:hypothetical protein